MAFYRHSTLSYNLSELQEKAEALIQNYELARRYVLGLYGWKGLTDFSHCYHDQHPRHIEDEVLCYAGVLAEENGGFWSTEMFQMLHVLDRLNPYEIAPSIVQEKLKAYGVDPDVLPIAPPVILAEAKLKKKKKE